ncbi:HD domain-containing protein [Pseudooceanicola sp. MF1-13]|uniref:HD domain-containing protein n=1 Tax=Pseudooceanicola sp. MF1-13 TaxID=3379095 RepID=UPI0038929CC8
MTHHLSRYDPVWSAAEPYMRARKNDVHIPVCFHWTLKLLDHFPEADRDICLLAILLHDIGWYAIDMEEIIEQGFRSDDILHSDVRYRHEAEGVRMGREVLEQTGWDEAVITQVCEIIDGHDTRDTARHLNDRIVRDADKLWRFSVTGIAIAADWFGTTPRGYADRLETEWNKLETTPGRDMARDELARSRQTLMLHVI